MTLAPPLLRRRRVAVAVAAPALATTLFTVTFAGQAVRNLVGWQGFAVLVAALLAVVGVHLWRARRLVFTSGLPWALTAFLMLSALSLLWSDYEWATVLGLTAQWGTAAAGVLIAATTSWPAIRTALSRSLRLILASSLGFELFVTLVLRHPLLPRDLAWGAAPTHGAVPGAYYWSENHLAELGPIQGIVGNRNLLAFLALLSLILTVVAVLERSGRRNAAAESTARNLGVRGLQQLRSAAGTADLLWAGVAVLTLGLTRSATVAAAFIAVAVVAALLLTIRRIPARRRAAAYSAAWVLVAVGAVASWASAHTLISLLGRDGATGRTAIWRTVAGLAEQHPIFGWGWISYWAPWVRPFDGLIVIDGVEYLQAHSALLDIWLQLGIVGVGVALTVAALVMLGAWRAATDGLPGLGRTTTPLLLVTALLFQSLTESRLLIEGNWLLFTVICSVIAAAGHQRRRLLHESVESEAEPQRSPVNAGASPTLYP